MYTGQYQLSQIAIETSHQIYTSYKTQLPTRVPNLSSNSIHLPLLLFLELAHLRCDGFVFTQSAGDVLCDHIRHRLNRHHRVYAQRCGQHRAVGHEQVGDFVELAGRTGGAGGRRGCHSAGAHLMGRKHVHFGRLDACEMMNNSEDWVTFELRVLRRGSNQAKTKTASRKRENNSRIRTTAKTQ